MWVRQNGNRNYIQNGSWEYVAIIRWSVVRVPSFAAECGSGRRDKKRTELKKDNGYWRMPSRVRARARNRISLCYGTKLCSCVPMDESCGDDWRCTSGTTMTRFLRGTGSDKGLHTVVIFVQMRSISYSFRSLWVQIG